MICPDCKYNDGVHSLDCKIFWAPFEKEEKEFRNNGKPKVTVEEFTAKAMKRKGLPPPCGWCESPEHRTDDCDPSFMLDVVGSGLVEK